MKNVTPCYFSRDLSWIDFNERVLAIALRPEVPPLDRLKFLSIAASNLDEFFMVRIATLKRAKEAGINLDPCGLSPESQLKEAAVRIRSMIAKQYGCLTQSVLPALAKEGLELVRPPFYSPPHLQFLESLFLGEIYPNLTPLKVEDGLALPTIGNLKLYGAFLLESLRKEDQDSPGGSFLSIVQIPSALERIVWLPQQNEKKIQWALLDDVILTWGYKLFPGYSVQESLLFKIVRDADFSVDEERDDDFIEAMAEVLAGREHSRPVRMSYAGGSARIRDELARRLELDADDLYDMPGPIDLRTLFELATLKGFDHLREPVWRNYWPLDLPEDGSLWDRIRESDVLLQLPYHSFEPVVRLLRDAAQDPQVLSIKMTLYRTSGDSPIVKALEEAARNGKHVTALVELKARFDEERNITWANRLEEAGVIVVYGLARLKVHGKICLIVRRESDGIRRYVHLSTGNYNDRTAKLYSDLGLFTCQEDMANDANLFFNMITGYSMIQSMRCLVVAPVSLKFRLIELIDREAKRASQGYSGRIMAKMNALADIDVINALYRASQAGVTVDLNIRGVCMLIPGVPGLSENIRVISIIDRYLEHSRIFYFANGGAEEVYLSSADWMSRNLERRVELMFPLIQEAIKNQVMEILRTYFLDTTHALSLNRDGTWTSVLPSPDLPPLRAQEVLYQAIRDRSETFKAAPRQEFIVRRRQAAE